MAGMWAGRDDPWHDQRQLYCALTGQLIPGRAWLVEIGGEKLSFSDPLSEQLYRRYVLDVAVPESGEGTADRRGG